MSADSLASHPDFQVLQVELPQMREKIQGIRGVSIGINLDRNLDPVGAVLLTIEDEPFEGRRGGILGRIFKKEDGPQGKLHQPPFKKLQVANHTLIQDPEIYGWAANPKSLPLFRDLAETLDQTARELTRKLQKFANLQVDLWKSWAEEAALLVESATILKSWEEQGIPLVFPELLPSKENRMEVRSMHHPLILMKIKPSDQERPSSVPNDLLWGDLGRIHIITGPNSGGKTVYLQCLGWAQVLTQWGWPLPASFAQVSPALSFHTHFQKEEKAEIEAGRFGEDVMRLKTIIEELMPGGVVLLNESLSGTNAQESYAIACDVVKALAVAGARAGFTTHLHELARDVGTLNQEADGASKMVSVTADPGTYKMKFRPPLGRSYASEIAHKYGLSFEALTNGMTKRGVLK